MERENSTVVDIRTFLEARERERLPLFDQAGGRLSSLPAARGRALSERELEHRQRMLRHLSGARERSLA